MPVVVQNANTTLNVVGVAVGALRELVGKMVVDLGISVVVCSVEKHQRQNLPSRCLGGRVQCRLVG